MYTHNVQFQKVPENIHNSPTEGIGNSWRVGGSQSPKDLRKCMKLDWNFQRGGGSKEKFPSVEVVWIIFGTTQFNQVQNKIQFMALDSACYVVYI